MRCIGVTEGVLSHGDYDARMPNLTDQGCGRLDAESHADNLPERVRILRSDFSPERWDIGLRKGPENLEPSGSPTFS